jgi:hypothetical protein
MKRLFLLATIVLSNYACANAQGTYQYSGDYLYSPFNDYSCTTHILSGSCPYWWEDDCPNGFEGWKRAHGTPSAATDPVTGLVDRVYMWGQTVTQNSEGIYHPFVFRQGGLYNIYLGIAGMNVTTGGRIEVWQ